MKKLLNNRCVKIDNKVRAFCNCPNGEIYPIVGQNSQQAINLYNVQSGMGVCDAYQRCFGGNSSPCMEGLVNDTIDDTKLGKTVFCGDLPEHANKKIEQSYLVCQVTNREVLGNKLVCLASYED